MNVIILPRYRSELQTQAIKYGNCLIMKILSLWIQKNSRVGFRKIANALFIPTCKKKLKTNSQGIQLQKNYFS